MIGIARPTRSSLLADLLALGLRAGDAVLVHAALRSVGPVIGGPDMVIAALRDCIGPDGTLLAYADWQGEDEVLADPVLRQHAPPFDPQTSRASRENGAFPELLRTTPGARRSGNPGASCVAIGRRAHWFTADHSLDYGYGEESPFARLVESGGKTLLLGAPLDTATLLHHAEHLARIPGKRIKRAEVPLMQDKEVVWRAFQEFDTADPVVEGLPDTYFADIVRDFLAQGLGRSGPVGGAPSVLADAAPLVRFAVNWLETRFR